jgi:N-sulfoglucosamine sulfohydrolase
MRTLLSFVATLFACTLVAPPVLAQNKVRNIVVIIADDMGRDLGCYGNAAVKTPHLDRLAKNGIRFTNAFATVASCSASRGSILTGMYTHQNGQFGHAHQPHGQTTHDWVRTLPALLRPAGYYSGLIGKFHVAPDALYPFDELVTKINARSPTAMSRRAREFITNAKNRPFFLYYASTDPHRDKVGFGNEAFADDPAEVKYDPKEVIVPPFLPDQPEVRREIAHYYQAISRFDRNVGLLLQVLKETGHENDTIVLFISDNGMPFPGAKTNLYDAGVHLPLIIASPDHKKGHTNHSMVSYIDLVPTILDWAKAKAPQYKGFALPGRSVAPILNEDKAKGWDVVFGSHQFHEITMYYPMRLVRTPRFAYIVNLGHKLDYPFASDLYASASWQGVLKRGDPKLGQRRTVDYLHRPLEELYDLSKDPHQLRNVANDPSYARDRADLRQQVVAWQERTRDPWSILYKQGLSLGKN